MIQYILYFLIILFFIVFSVYMRYKTLNDTPLEKVNSKVVLKKLRCILYGIVVLELLIVVVLVL